MKHHQIIGFLMISERSILNRLLWSSEASRLLVVKWRRAGNIWSPSTLFSTKLRLMASTCSTKLHVHDCTANLFEMWLWIICEQSGMWVASCHAGYAVWLNETRKSARGRLKSVNQIIYIYRNVRVVTIVHIREWRSQKGATVVNLSCNANLRRTLMQAPLWSSKMQLLGDTARSKSDGKYWKINYCILLFIFFKEGQRPQNIRKPSEQDCSA